MKLRLMIEDDSNLFGTPVFVMTDQTTINPPLSFDVCRAARVARDARYDGLFFSGAASTKVYCRPTCPGKPPLESNTVFFKSRAQAEAAGFRPCLRCRPELAPDPPLQKVAGWQVRCALGRIHRGMFPDDDLPGVQSLLVGASPDREPEDFHAVVGATVSQYAKTFQSGFAKMVLTDTPFPLEDVAVAAGFDTPETMLNVLSRLHGRDPLAFRRPLPVQTYPGVKSCALMLSYRPPFDWSALLGFLRARTITGVETVTDETYRRSFSLHGCRGWFALQNVPQMNAIRLGVHASDLSCLMQVVWRVRRMLDLDADPLALGTFFGNDPLLGIVWQRHPGLRVPVCWDGVEFAVRAIVGQVVSVTVATKLVGNIAGALGDNLSPAPPEGIEKVFPGPDRLLEIEMQSCGLSRNKALAIATLARAVVDGDLDLETACNPDDFIKRCTALRGIGEWTAQTIAMRGLGDADAFPAGDLGIVKSLAAAGHPLTPALIRKMAERWRPYRSYAAMLLWMMRTK